MNRELKINRAWIRWFVPRATLGIWGGGFILCGLYLLKKSIDTDGFTQTQTPGEGGDVGKSHWTMVDHNGQTVSKDDFLGKYTLMYFGFTFCPDVCPVEMKKMAEIIDILEADPRLTCQLKKKGIESENETGKRETRAMRRKKNEIEVIPIMVSVDYRRDGPKLMKQYVRQYHDSLVGLCGTEDQIAHFAQTMRTYFSRPPDLAEDYILEHSTYMYFAGRDGNFMHLTNTEDSPQVLADKIRGWIADDGTRWDKFKYKFKRVFS